MTKFTSTSSVAKDTMNRAPVVTILKRIWNHWATSIIKCISAFPYNSSQLLHFNFVGTRNCKQLLLETVCPEKNHLKSPLRLSSKSLTHIQAGNHDTKATNPKSRKMTDEIRCRSRSDLFANLPTVYFVLNTISLTPETKNALIANCENDFKNWSSKPHARVKALNGDIDRLRFHDHETS